MVNKTKTRAIDRTFSEVCSVLLKEFGKRRPIRAGSLVVSVFGDAFAPHGGDVWLGSIIKALHPFGVSDRLVRTSVFRLVAQGWLESEKIGRRSYYRMTEKGTKRFLEASRRIYSEPLQDWRGSWCLILIAGVDSGSREEIRRELGWLGFAPFSTNVLAHPAPSIQEVEDRLAEMAGGENALIMDAQTHPGSSEYLRALVSDAWQFGELDARYEAFLKRFRPAYIAARNDSEIDKEYAFCLRLLLIHEYRRVLLRDPSLPEALLPERWNGTAAYQLCRNLYTELAPAAEEYLTSSIENVYGPLPPADGTFHKRFSGQVSNSTAPMKRQ